MHDDETTLIGLGLLIVVLMFVMLAFALHDSRPQYVLCDVGQAEVRFDIPTDDVQDFEYPEGADNCRLKGL